MRVHERECVRKRVCVFECVCGSECSVCVWECVSLFSPPPPPPGRVGWSVGDSGLGLGEAQLSYGYGSTGKGVVNNQYNEYGEAYGPGDVITCLLVSVV